MIGREFNIVIYKNTTQRTQFYGTSYLGQHMDTKCEKSYILIVQFTFFTMWTEWNVRASLIQTSDLLSAHAPVVKWVDINSRRLSLDEYGPVMLWINLWSFARVTNAGLERLSTEGSRCTISSLDVSVILCRLLDVASEPRTPESGFSGTAAALWHSCCWWKPRAR
jgi:hypothetical protein